MCSLVGLNEADDVISAVMELSRYFLYSFATKLFRQPPVLEMVAKFTFELLRYVSAELLCQILARTSKLASAKTSS